jgi:hypothetical protein
VTHQRARVDVIDGDDVPAFQVFTSVSSERQFEATG